MKENIVTLMASSSNLPPHFVALFMTDQYLDYNMALNTAPSNSCLGSYNYNNIAPSQITRDYFNT